MADNNGKVNPAEALILEQNGLPATEQVESQAKKPGRAPRGRRPLSGNVTEAAATASAWVAPTEAQVEAEAQGEVGVAPKTFLIPYVLLMLRDSLLHGYGIWEKLTLMGIPGLNEGDRATIYRTLRQLEREGKVKSVWDTNTEGPARRVYSLTDAGELFLKSWAVGLDQYRQSLDFFFKMYAGGVWPNPFGFGLTNSPKGKK